MPKAEVITFGCRLNTYESSLIEGALAQVPSSNRVVFNTCAVTNEAERQAKQAIRRHKRKNPKAFVVVTGCSAQLNPSMFQDMPEVDVVLGNREKLDPRFYQKTKGVFVGDMEAVPSITPLVPSASQKARAFLEIQTGCDHSCTFCVITHARGPSVSVPFEKLKARIKAFVHEGVKEVVLTGVDLTSYGSDDPTKGNFSGLVAKLLADCGDLPRLRVSSLDPAEVDDRFLAFMESDERLMPHVHLSVQAGADLILKRMKRRHLKQDVINFCARIREARPDMVLGADFIAGFPTETDEHFEETCALVEACELALLHVFPFSPRPGTPAARMPQCSREVILKRARHLRRLGERVLHHVMERFVGKSLSVLLEKPTRGYSQHYMPVCLEKPVERKAGQIVACQALDIVPREGKNYLLAKPLEGA